jgi:hypothetical protein
MPLPLAALAAGGGGLGAILSSLGAGIGGGAGLGAAASAAAPVVTGTTTGGFGAGLSSLGPSIGAGLGDLLSGLKPLLEDAQFTIRTPQFGAQFGGSNRRLTKALEQMLIKQGTPDTTETAGSTPQKNQQGDLVSSLFPLGLNPMTVRGPRMI